MGLFFIFSKKYLFFGQSFALLLFSFRVWKTLYKKMSNFEPELG